MKYVNRVVGASAGAVICMGAALARAQSEPSGHGIRWDACESSARGESSRAAFSYAEPTTGQRFGVELEIRQDERGQTSWIATLLDPVARTPLAAVSYLDDELSGAFAPPAEKLSGAALSSFSDVFSDAALQPGLQQCVGRVPGLERLSESLALRQPAMAGFDCGCWEDPATGDCVALSCSCDGPLSCFVLEVGCGISGGDWDDSGGWGGPECTWGNVAPGLGFVALPDHETYCGGWLGDTCSAGEYCAYEGGNAICGYADATAVCKERPQACTLEYEPVCGCDGASYSNACWAAAAGTGVMSEGACPDPTQVIGFGTLPPEPSSTVPQSWPTGGEDIIVLACTPGCYCPHIVGCPCCTVVEPKW